MKVNGATAEGCRRSFLRLIIHAVIWPMLWAWFIIEITHARPSECGTLEHLNQQYANAALDQNGMQLKSLAYQWYNANCRGMKTEKRSKPLKRR